jgi:hypothetical protein
VEYCDEIDAPEIQHILSFGLEKLYAIAGAETYEERYQVLNAHEIPDHTYEFLHGDFQYAHKPNDAIWPDDLSLDDEMFLIRRPFFADPDSGPVYIWRWAHVDQTWQDWVFQTDQHILRQWGYVMWDRSRLEVVGAFQKPWDWKESRKACILLREEASRERADTRESRNAKEAIHRKGGTGWWDQDDLSKVKWSNGKQPEKKPPPPYSSLGPPSSIVEARDMWNKMKLPPAAKPITVTQ